MKKIAVFTIILSFVFIGTLSAQGLGFGVKGGLNMAKYTGDGVKEITDSGFDQKYQMGFSAGAFITLPLGSTLAIRPEVLYTQNGAKFEGPLFDSETTIYMQMNWLNIPVLAVINLQPNLRLFAGPYFDFFLSGKTKFENALGDEEADIESEDVKSLLYGVVAGAAFGVTDNIDVEARYSLGLNNYDKEPDNYQGTYEETDLKPTMIQLLLNFYLAK